MTIRNHELPADRSERFLFNSPETGGWLAGGSGLLLVALVFVLLLIDWGPDDLGIDVLTMGAAAWPVGIVALLSIAVGIAALVVFSRRTLRR